MSGICQYCGREIYWTVEPTGRKVPRDMQTGEAHFAHCRGWKKRKAEESAKQKAEREREEARRQMRLF